MSDETNKVDILSLEDFRKTLDYRLSSAQSVLTALNGALANGEAQLGTFADANSAAWKYKMTHEEHVKCAQQLISAIEAAQTATDTIIRNYTTTEARNKANSADIASVLGGITTLLSSGGDPR